MHVIQHKKAVFLHNPKTAGRSTIISFGFPDTVNYRLAHLGAQEARTWIFQDTWASYFSFCFVRNPWARLVSLYEYQRSVNYIHLRGTNESHILARNYNFCEWVKVNETSLRKARWFGIPQSHWTNGVSRVYKLEEYEDAFSELSTRLEMTPTLLHLNATLHAPYHEYYLEKAAIDFVSALERETIVRFGYSF